MTDAHGPDKTLDIGGTKFALYIEENARRQIQDWIEELDSSYLRRNVIEFHQRDGYQVQMLKRINILLAQLNDDGSPIGFIAAEQEGENDIAILHMLYVRKNFRGQGFARTLVMAFESLLGHCKVKTLRLVPGNRLSLGFFERVASRSALTYEIVRPSSPELDYGDSVLETEI